MKRILIIALFILMLFGCRDDKREITLYSELHGYEDILDREIEIIDEFYKKGGRNIFLENGYSQGVMLNKWMKSDNDEILDKLIELNKGESLDIDEIYEYYKTIKKRFPEIVFIPTDIEHIGPVPWLKDRFDEIFMKDIYPTLTDEEKRLTDKSIEQGIECYGNCNEDLRQLLDLRELKLGPNMIEAIKNTKGDAIGFYGRNHLFGRAYDKTMFEQVREEFPWVKAVDLVKDYEAPVIKTVELEIARKKYEADLLIKRYSSYDSSVISSFGVRPGYGQTTSFEVFRIKNADDLKKHSEKGELMSYYELHFKINEGDLFLLRYNKSGKGVPPIDRLYYAKGGLVNDEGFKSLIELNILE